MGETVGQLGEKRLLQQVILPMINPGQNPHLAGDDCGIVGIGSGQIVCVSTDRVPWDLTAYHLKIMSEYDLGYYLAVLNISDIAAMGAKPTGLLLNIALPSDFPIKDLVQIFKGALAAATEYNCSIIGGDLSEAHEPSLCATSIGYTNAGECIFRKGSQPGDSIVMTPPFGLCATAFRYYRDAKPHGMILEKSSEEALKAALIRPVPQIATGQRLARHNGRVTVMDNTDGLSQTIVELAEINQMHYSIDVDLLTIDELTNRVGAFLGEDPISIGMGPGADMNLVGTVDDASIIDGKEIVRIGTVQEGSGVSITTSGATRPLKPNGWDYFTKCGTQ